MQSRVSNYYAGRSIFLTGGTGFMGKVLIEKLLRSCPDIGHIYVLTRPKKGQPPQTRLDDILGGRLFQSVSYNTPDALKKVTAISGEITEPNLGISPLDMARLVDNVSVIFHVAATIRFDQELTESIKINVYGTKEVISFARKLSNLSSIIDVSTAYSHCYLSTPIEEKFYPMPSNICCSSSAEAILEMCVTAKGQGRDCTKDIIGVFPNTYTFTKALAESVLEQNASDLPIAIIRPSIVTASWKEPFPGWIDNFNGPTGLFAASGGGSLHTVYAKHDKRADLIPVDVAINLMCVLAWSIGTQPAQQNTPRAIPIYNCTSGSTVTSLCWPELQSILVNMHRKHPMEQKIWYPSTKVYNYPIVDSASRILLHWIPAYCGDAFFWLTGKKRYSLVKITKRLAAAMDTLKYFVSNEWTWNTQKVITLYNKLDYEDQSRFNFSMGMGWNWDGYIENYVLGIREFLLKSDPNTLESCRKNLWKYYVLHCTFKLCALYMVYMFMHQIWILIMQ